jgi:hypothetical protein
LIVQELRGWFNRSVASTSQRNAALLTLKPLIVLQAATKGFAQLGFEEPGRHCALLSHFTTRRKGSIIIIIMRIFGG